MTEYQAGNETKSRFQKLGVAFINQNGSINVILDAAPFSGKLQLQVPMTQEERDAMYGQRGDRQPSRGNAPQAAQRPQPGRQGGQRFGGRQPAPTQAVPEYPQHDTEEEPPF